MKIKGPGFLIAAMLLATAAATAQDSTQSILQQPRLPRLETSVLDVQPPAQRVSGTPGSLRIVERSCRSLPAAGLRERIVHTAVQEWAWFGFQVDDLRNEPDQPDGPGTRPRWRLGLIPDQVAEVAASIGGYWAAIPASDWILERQNEAWRQPGGLAMRWRDPWSAAFISWVMCESGLAEQRQFQRAIAHHSYIDQAIRARDAQDANAAYHAYEPGETSVAPGDLLCNGLRPMYRSLRERRAQLGEGARTHCDIVVQVDADRILTIGGNVRASVRMKIHAAGLRDGGPHPAPLAARRPVFAHLKLRTDGTPAAGTELLQQSPTLQQLSCSMPAAAVDLAALDLNFDTARC